MNSREHQADFPPAGPDFSESLQACAWHRRALVAGGKSKLDVAISRWNQPSNKVPFLVLRDWDVNDGPNCVPEHVEALLGTSAGTPRLALRIPVRATESWLLADAEAFQAFFSTTYIPPSPMAKHTRSEQSSTPAAVRSAARFATTWSHATGQDDRSASSTSSASSSSGKRRGASSVLGCVRRASTERSDGSSKWSNKDSGDRRGMTPRVAVEK